MNRLVSKWGIIVLMFYVLLQVIAYIMESTCDGECIGEGLLMWVVNLPSHFLSIYIDFGHGWFVYSLVSTFIVYVIALILERIYIARSH